MPMISDDVVIMTKKELDARDNAWFQRGVARGRFEESMDRAKDSKAEECTKEP
jgi:hypothetical protein